MCVAIMKMSRFTSKLEYGDFLSLHPNCNVDFGLTSVKMSTPASSTVETNLRQLIAIL